MRSELRASEARGGAVSLPAAVRSQQGTALLTSAGSLCTLTVAFFVNFQWDHPKPHPTPVTPSPLPGGAARNDDQEEAGAGTMLPGWGLSPHWVFSQYRSPLRARHPWARGP